MAKNTQKYFHLNLSGEKITITKELLCSEPNSVLEAMFSGRHDDNLETVNGEIIIDRDPEAFKMMLQYLRNPDIVCDFQSKFKEDLFDKELNYWGITKMHPNLIKLERIFNSEPKFVN